MRPLRLRPGARIGLVHEGNLGDIIATLPMAGLLKRAVPGCVVVFIGRRYGRALALASHHVDAFLDSDTVREDAAALAAARLDVLLNPFPYREIARTAAQARIPIRVGNLRRGAYARWCNRFVFYGRAGTRLHEAVLNLRDLRALGFSHPVLAPDEMVALCGLTRLQPLAPDAQALLTPGRFHLLLQTKSNGNGREWPLSHFLALAQELRSYPVQLLLTGTGPERAMVQAECPALLAAPQVTDVFGRFSLAELLSFIAAADGLVSSGTGPLHLAAALGIHALGIYPPRDSTSAQRWYPLGPKGEALQIADSCPAPCGWNDVCRCMAAITPHQVAERVLAWLAQAGYGPHAGEPAPGRANRDGAAPKVRA